MRRLFLFLFITTISFLSYSQPVITNANWFDQDSDGQIDRVTLTFDVNVDITDATPGTGVFDVILINGGAITFDDSDYTNPNQPSLTLNFTGNQINTTDITGLTVTYQAGASIIVNAGGAMEIADGEVVTNGGTYSDSAAPQITDFEYEDNDSDGMIDRFVVSFSEALDAASSLSANDLIFTNNGDFNGALFGADATDLITGSVSSVTVVLGTESTVVDTEENSGTIAISTQNSFSLTDGTNTNNTLGAQAQATFSDGAAPQISDFLYQDNDLDGQIDRFIVSFSETLDAASVLSADDLLFTDVGDFTSAAFGADATDIIVAAVSSVTVVLGTESGVVDTEENSGTIAISTQNAFSLTDGTNTNNTTGAQAQATFSDGAAPQIADFEYQDNDVDGQIDRFVVTFSEALDAASSLSANNLLFTDDGDFDGVLFGGNNSNLLGAGGETNVTVVLGTESTVTDTEENSGTIAISTQNAFSLTDGTNTNATLGAQGQATFSDGAGPVIISAVTSDNDLNGQIDRMTLTFSENIDDGNSGVFDNTTVDVAGYAGEAKVSGDDDNAEVIISFTESGSGDTDATPNVTLLSGQVEDASTNSIGSSQVFSGTADGAAPQITDFEYQDNDNDGMIDRFVVSFSELLDAASSLSADDLLFTDDGDFDGALFGPDATDLITGSVSSVTVVLGTESTVVDTEENSGTLAITTQNTFNLTDGVNTNSALAVQTQATFTDGAGPVIASAVTADNDLNGQIDRITLTFSENIDDGNSGVFDNTTVDVAGYAGEAKVSGDDDNAEVIISFTESGSGDTDATPNVTLLSGQVEDASTNSIGSSQVFSGTTDGAAPQITDFEYQDNDNDGMIDRFVVSFSESLDAASSLSADDLLFTDDGDFDGALFGADATDLITGSVSSVIVVLGTESTVVDTEENSATIAVNTQNAFSLTDGTNTNNTLGAQAQATFSDGAAPQITDFEYQDNDNDGMIDRFVVSFSETLDGASVLSADDLLFTDVGDFASAAFGADATDLITGSVASVIVVLGTESTVADTEENSGTIAISSQNAFSLTDGTNTNSALVAQTQATFTDGAGPVIASAVTADNDLNGQIDRITLTFSENIDDGNSGVFDNTTVDVAGYAGEAKVSGDDDNAEVIISFTESGSGDTDTTPNVTLLSGQVEDASTNSIGSSQVFSGTTDGAAPQITDFEYQDNDNDGMIDRFVVSFSESLDAASSLSADDLLFTDDGDFDGALFGADATDLITGSVSSVIVVLGTESTVVDTEENSATIAVNTQNAFSLTDGTNTNNTLGAQAQATFTDGAAPIVADLEIFDTTLDGFIDRIDITFSENIDTDNGAAPITLDLGTLTLPDGEVVSEAISAPTISVPAGATNIVSVTGIADQLTENTSIGSLGIDGLTGLWEDASGNAITASGDDFETLTDGASPALVSSFPADNSASFPPANNLTLTFSEDVVFGSGNIDLNNITTPASSVSYDVTSATELSLATNTVTIDPATNLTLTNEYAIQVAASAIDDAVGNSYPGILNNDDLDFIANNTAPVECTFDYQTTYDEPNSGSDNGHLAASQCNTDPGVISSLIDSQTEAVSVFHYHLLNGSNGRENVTSVTFRRGSGDDVDWSVALAGAILIDENGQSQAGVINSDNIAFTSIPHGNGQLGDLPGNDDGDDGTYLGKEYALRIWFNTNLGVEAVDIDGKDLIFELSTADMANVDRVSLAGAPYTTSSTPITTSVTVNVVATEYAFLQQPSDVSATAVMTPAVTLEAIDENGNRDLDYDNVADAVQITSTGTLSPVYATPSVANASDWVNGVGTVSEIVHNLPASGRELNTTAGALTDAPTSSTFEVTADMSPPVFLNAYYYDTDGDGDIDEVAVEMGEEIDETSADENNFTIGSGTVDAAVLSLAAVNPLDATDNDQYFTLQVTVPGTQATTLAYTQGTLADISANLANSNASITTVDVADPIFVAAHFFDSETVNGVIDEVVIEMSEPIEDGSIVAADFSIDGAAPTLDASISNSLDPDATDDQYFTLQVSLVGTSTFSTSYSAGSLADIATNAAASDASITESDMASPIIINSLSIDSDGNGNTDAIELEFSENVKDITFALSLSDWIVSSDNFVSGLQDDVITGFSSEVTDLAAVNAFDDEYVRLEWTPSNTSGTGAYHLEYTNGGDDITDNSSNLNAIADFSNLAITDGALPILLSASTIDDGNGYLDGILVRFSDVIDVAGTLDEDPTGGFDDFLVTGGYTITAVTPVAGAGINDDEIILTVAEMGAFDTDATPDVTVNGGELDDTDANTIPGATLTASDNADPVFISATTADSDSDGQIDEITILFSEDVDAGTIDEISAGGFDDFSVAGFTISAVTPAAGSGVDDDEIILTITQSGSNDTGATPDVTLNASQVNDLVANTASTATLTSIDGAPILITDATWNDVNTVDGNIDQVVLTFSEPVDISDALLGTDGFDGVQINGGANAIDLGNYSADGVTSLTLNFDGSPITGTGISGHTVAYVAAGLNDIIEDGVSANEMQDALAPIDYTDNATPIANTISISSNNATNSTHAVTGNTVTLAFTIDDDFSTDPTVTFRSGGATVDNAVTIDNSSAPNYEATYDVSAIDRDGNVTFTLNFTDDGGNAGTTVTAVSDASSVTVDNTIPTLTITRNAPAAGTVNGTNSNSVSFDLAFSEVMDAGFTFNDITLNTSGVTANALVGGDLVDDGGGNYTLTVSGITGDGTLGITVSGTGSPDPAGNTLAANVVSSVFAIDNTAPTATITRNAVSSGSFTGTNDASISFDIAFSTAIDNSTFVLGDVTINNPGGVTLGAASLTSDGDNQNYTFTIPITSGNGNISISMAAGSVADAATNGLGSAASSGTITIDNTAPTASNVTLTSNNADDTQAVTGNTVTLSFTVDDNLTGNPAVVFRSGGVAVAGTVTIGGSNPNYTASYIVDASDRDGNVTFTLNFTDDAGNAATQVTSVSGSGAGTSVNVDNTIPTLTITRNAPGTGSVSGTNSNSVSFDLAFSEVMDTGFTFADISRNLSGVTTNALNAGSLVDNGGGNYTLTVSGIAGNGTLGITVSGAGSPDPAGNTLAANVVSELFTIDNTAPTATITRNAVSSGSFTGTNDASISFDIAFSTAIDNSTFVLGDVTINNPGGVTLGAASLTPDGDNQNYTYTIPITSGNGDISISLAANSVEDAATNGLGSLASSGTITIDNAAPTASNVTIVSNNGTNTDQAITGNTVTLSFTVNDDLTGNPTVAFRSGGVSVAGTVTIGGSNPNYTASYNVDAGDKEGNVTFTLNFTDDAGNAATQVTSVSGSGAGTSVNVDNTIPTLTITRNAPAAGTADGTNSNSVSFDLAFSEVMDAGFTFADISTNLTGVTASALTAGSLVNDGGGNYTLTVSGIAGDGTLGVTVSGAGSPDPAGNTLAANVVSNLFTIDNTAPTLQTATVNSSTSITVAFSDNMQILSNTPGDFSISDAQGTAFTVTGVSDGTAGDANLILTVNNFSGSVGDLTLTYASSSSNYADLSTNSLADDATGLLIERDLNLTPALSENSTGLTEDVDSDVAMYRTNTSGVETSTPITITPNITGTSTITIYSDAALSTVVYQETNVAATTSPTLADFFPAVDFSDGTEDHGIYTFYITETATNSVDSEGPSAKYSIALLDAVELSPNLTAFSEDDNSGTTLTVRNHPSDQTLTFSGNGLTDFDYGTTVSDVRFVPSSAGNTNSPHNIRLEFENADGEKARFIAQTLVVNSANNVFNAGQTTSFCRVDGIEVINVNSNPSGIDTGEDGDTSQPDFYDVEVYYVKNGSAYTNWKPNSAITTGIADAGNIARIILPYDRDGDDADDRDDVTLGITSGIPTFALNGIWKIDPSALTDDLFDVSTDRSSVDTLRFIYYATNNSGSVSQRISQVDVYFYPDPVVEITSPNDVVCEDEDPFALSATLNGLSVTVDSYEISLGGSSATITGNLFDPANPLGMATAPDDPSGDYQIVYTSDLSDGGNGCTDTDTINVEVLAKPDIRTLDTDISGRGELVGNVYTLEYCEGETFDELSITIGLNEEIRWFTNPSLTTSLDIVDGNADGSSVTATDFFGYSQVQGGEDEDFFYVLVDNTDKGGVCQSDAIQVRFIGHSTPDIPEADLTSSTAGGLINSSSVEYNYCVNTGASATIEDIVLNPLPASGESYFTVLADDTVLFAQLTNTTMQFDSLLSDLSPGASYEFEILIVDHDNSFPATEPAEGREFTGCASDKLTITINVFEIPNKPDLSEFSDNPNDVSGVVAYYMCEGESLPDISINPPDGVNEYLYDWFLNSDGTNQVTLNDTQDDRIVASDYNNAFGVDVRNTPGTYTLYMRLNSNVRDDAGFTGCTSGLTQVDLIVYPIPDTPTVSAPTNTSTGALTGGFDYSFNYCVDASAGLASNTPFNVSVLSSPAAGNDDRVIWFTASDDGTAIVNANPVAFGTNVTAANLGLSGATNETFQFALIHNTDLVPGYDDFEGCFSDTVFMEVLVSTIPATQFRIDGITAGEPTTFSFFDVNASTIATDGVVFEVRDASNTLVNSVTQDDLTPATFSIPTAGTFTASLSISSEAGCELTETRTFQILEKITVTGIYSQDFESSDGGWLGEFQSDDGLTGDLNTPARQNSWAWGAKTNAGEPDIVNFTSGANGTSRGWHTNLSGTYQGGEESYVYSPTFDISALVNPALSLYTFRSLDSSKDGVVMQYSTDGGEIWKNIGDYNPANTVPSTGNNWYTENGISSAPGDLTVGWGAGLSTDYNDGDVGWANQEPNPQNQTWLESVHALEFDGVDDLSNVRFRFALGASGAVTDVKDGLGFSFDEFTIFQLDRNVLVEQFSSLLSATSRTVSNAVEQSTPNILTINYFTGLSNSGTRFDQLNRRSKAGPAARSSYYGIDQVPSSVLDGELYPQSDQLNWDENDIEVKSIQPTKFLLPLGARGVRIDNDGTDDQRIEASISFVAQNSVAENLDLTFHFAVVEKEVLIADIIADDPNFDIGVYQPNDTLRNVLRVMLPDAAGYSYKGVVNPGQSFDYTIEWDITNVYSPDELRVIAFVQNRKTKQILQAGWGEVNGKSQLALGLEDQLAEMDIYPNPADGEVTLDFKDPILENTEWIVFDQSGREVLKGQIVKGTRTLTVETKDVPSGLYFIYLYAEERKRQSRRILIVH